MSWRDQIKFPLIVNIYDNKIQDSNGYVILEHRSWSHEILSKQETQNIFREIVDYLNATEEDKCH